MQHKHANKNTTHGLLIKNFSSTDKAAAQVDYQLSLAAMQNFTRHRSADTIDQLWILEHSPVYTLGQAASERHLHDTADIPVIKTDRGGQVTYHGPGQLMFYLLANLDQLGMGVRELVMALEQATINVLAGYGVTAIGNRDAPGVYVDDKKIAALGLRVSRRSCYHGLCFNYNFDAAPFAGINPCGYQGLQTAQLSDYLSPPPAKIEVINRFVSDLIDVLGYSKSQHELLSWHQDSASLD
jgi:lipoyl(octanoyl) transferase